MATGPAKAGIGFLAGISSSKELPSAEEFSRELTRANTKLKGDLLCKFSRRWKSDMPFMTGGQLFHRLAKGIAALSQRESRL
jgi:hypothetical protein